MTQEVPVLQIEDVLVPIDFSPPSMHAVDFVRGLMPKGGEIHLLHVVDEAFVERASQEALAAPKQLTEQMRKRAEERLERLAADHRGDGLAVTPIVVVGRPFLEILRMARELQFQMLVIGTRGRHPDSLEQMLFGNTAEHVLRGAHLPVLCVPHPGGS